MKYLSLILILLILTGYNASAEEVKVNLGPSTAFLKAKLSEEQTEKYLLALKLMELEQKLIEKDADSAQEKSDSNLRYTLARILILVESFLLVYCTILIKKLRKLGAIKKEHSRLEALNQELKINLQVGMEPLRLAKIDLKDLKDKYEYKIELDKTREIDRVKKTAQDTSGADTKLAKVLADNIQVEDKNKALLKDHLRLIKVGQILGKFDSDDHKPLATELLEALNLVRAINK
ncbi:hypothetical protein G6692_03680 [Polynucleobacter paneuropaeus]|uniref:Uncharacterized protein n=1 Tax=Polynucleobacter paneuropaeus TaxID=2527775 RepID=A0AAE2YK67_9BURK|nr:hypothetical protein [Polynucleobacter paneuropaeus]MBT8591009.1 hypothetical protein [Polynucleobacter paneuropaeus]MBT8596400.1 hypothetical protein [Polynucleobacter paneuropaeus]MBT8598213.1 hypothetical protein [Polynucleobacter paneuropaeus]